MIPQIKFNAVFVSILSAGNTVKAKNLLCLRRFLLGVPGEDLILLLISAAAS